VAARPGERALHDHGDPSGAFTVLYGALDETVVDVAPLGAGAVRERLWTRGAIRPFGSRHIHRVGNDGNVPAVSLHAYRPSLKTMQRFVRGRHGLTPVATERAGRDW
jgi:Cysteine dioxygenase type I